MFEPSKHKKKVQLLNWRYLRISLKYRPEILKLILKMRQRINNKNLLLKKLTMEMKKMVIL